MSSQPTNYMQKPKNFMNGNFSRIMMGVIFTILVAYYVFTFSFQMPNYNLLIISAIFGAYMAMNIGANDVANNVGPAVGSSAVSIFWAIIIAVIFESAGALIAGGDVVGTIKKGIIDPSLIQNADIFIWIMMAALLAGALWLNLATALGAPVSTTHSIVGGVTGAGIAAAGWSIVNWSKMGAIVASWVISPVMGGLIAAAFLIFIKKTVIFKDDIKLAAKTIVPIMIALMTWAFSTYILLKGFKHIIKLNFITASAIGLVIALILYFLTKPFILRAADKLPNTRATVNTMFNIPLIFSAALLSF
ncbi:MAG: inorganic phosphate transporter, partial [Campylobacteraceae bacterium]|nr:inorganic phosphate transporter [Campylobacteraceae bacterium]